MIHVILNGVQRSEESKRQTGRFLAPLGMTLAGARNEIGGCSESHECPHTSEQSRQKLPPSGYYADCCVVVQDLPDVQDILLRQFQRGTSR